MELLAAVFAFDVLAVVAETAAGDRVELAELERLERSGSIRSSAAADDPREESRSRRRSSPARPSTAR